MKDDRVLATGGCAYGLVKIAAVLFVAFLLFNLFIL